MSLAVIMRLPFEQLHLSYGLCRRWTRGEPPAGVFLPEVMRCITRWLWQKSFGKRGRVPGVVLIVRQKRALCPLRCQLERG